MNASPLRLPDAAFLEAAPDWFEHVPRELRLFGDWEQSSAGVQRVFAQTVAAGLRERRVRLPDDDARVLLRWADKPYGF